MLALLILSAACGCSKDKNDEMSSRDFVAMDTVFSLKIGSISNESGNSEAEVFDECEKLTANIENVLSATINSSDVADFNSDIDMMLDADPVFIEVLTVAMDLSELTNGSYDPAIGVLTSLWNVKGGGPVPSAEAIASAMEVCGTSNIEITDNGIRKLNPDVKLDLGGIGKGYAAQKLAEYLYSAGVSYGIVSAGRTVGVFGTKPDGSSFKIGIADPSDANAVVGYLYAGSGFVSVAGDYEQYFEADGVRYHHIIDPATGYPSDSGLSSVAVFSQNGATADALSTAFMVMGYEKSMEFYKSSNLSFEAVFIGTDGSVMLTDGLTSEKFELSDKYKDSIHTGADITVGTESTVYTTVVTDTAVQTSDTETVSV